MNVSQKKVFYSILFLLLIVIFLFALKISIMLWCPWLRDSTLLTMKSDSGTGDERMFTAAARADIKELKKLVDEGASWLGRDEKGRTILHIAAEKGNYECFMFLVSLGGLNINDTDNYGRTVLDEVMTPGEIDNYLKAHGGKYSWKDFFWPRNEYK